MALDDLLARLEREAEARADAILEEARAEAARIEAEAARGLARRREERLARREMELRQELEEELVAARQRGRAAALRARADFLDRTFAAARERLEGSEEADARRRSLPERLTGALAFVDGKAVVACAPEVETEARAAVVGREEVEVVPEPGLGGGFVVRSVDGRLEIDERLAARLARARDRLAVEIVDRVRRSGEAAGEGPS